MTKIVVIPAYEPPESFPAYAEQVLQRTDALVVVNDGSGCFEAFPAAIKRTSRNPASLLSMFAGT